MTTWLSLYHNHVSNVDLIRCAVPMHSAFSFTSNCRVPVLGYIYADERLRLAIVSCQASESDRPSPITDVICIIVLWKFAKQDELFRMCLCLHPGSGCLSDPRSNEMLAYRPFLTD